MLPKNDDQLAILVNNALGLAREPVIPKETRNSQPFQPIRKLGMYRYDIVTMSIN